jgi:SulP family sulfate permease
VRLPVFTWLPGYDRGWLRGDLVAGLTVWAVLVPEALAYASIAGVSPVVGLYAAPGALILYAAFGSSRHLVTGPMAATAALSAAAVGDLATQGADEFVALTVTLGLVTGILAVVAGLLRLGFLASFISEPVLKGFIIGLALTIIVGQLPKLFGVEKGEGNFFEQLWELLTELGGTSGLTLLVGLASLVLVVVLKERAPVVPGSLVAVALGILAVRLFDLDQHGVAIVGEIEGGLPSFGLPDVAAERYLDLAPSAVGVMLIAFAEGLGAAKTYAARNNYEIDANGELIGLGAANLASGVSSGMAVNGSLSKTAVNASAGAKSQVSGLVVAALTIVTLLFLTGLFEELPEATLAAVVIAALIELVDIRALVELYRLYTRRLGRIYGVAARPDFIAALAALFGVLIFDTLPGLFIGIGVALLLLLYRASRPHVRRAREGSGEPRPVRRRLSAPGERATSRRGGHPRRERAVLRERRLGARPHPGSGQRRDEGDRARRGEHPNDRRHRPAHADRPCRRSRPQRVRLLLAHDVGQVRDLIRHAEGEEALRRLYPTVQDAVDAVRHSRNAGR